MLECDTLIRSAKIFDGSDGPPAFLDIAICDGRICAIGSSLPHAASRVIEAHGLALAPGFIDVHTHDDTAVIRRPEMLPKISQGVTTVITGNCGISAAPVRLRGDLPDPMNLLGSVNDFRYPTLSAYVEAIREAKPAVNVAALVGHT